MLYICLFQITDAIPGLITIDTVGEGTAQLQVLWHIVKNMETNYGNELWKLRAVLPARIYQFSCYFDQQVELTYNMPNVDGEGCEYEVDIKSVEHNENVLNDAIPVKNWKNDKKIVKGGKEKMKKCRRSCKRKCCKGKCQENKDLNEDCRKKCKKQCRKKLKGKEQGDQVTNRIKIELCIR